MRFSVLFAAALVVASVAEADEPRTMANVLPPNACQPCHQTTPKLKLLPRDLSDVQPTERDDPALIKMFQGMPTAPPSSPRK